VTTHATITLTPHGLELRCPTAGLTLDQPLADADTALLADWTARYQTLARADRAAGPAPSRPGNRRLARRPRSLSRPPAGHGPAAAVG
jgi:hypothetical protein